MSQLPFDAAASALVARLDDDVALVRAAAADALASFPGGPERLRDALTQGSDAAREAAAAGVGRARLAALTGDLVARLSDGSPGVRVAAALALIPLGDGAPALMEALASDPAPEVRRAAVRALAALKPDGTAEALVAALGDEAVRDDALAGLGALGWTPDSGTGEAVLALARRDLAALEALGDVAVPLLGRAVRDPAPDKDSVLLRAALLDVLGDIGTAAAARAALPALDDVGGPARAAAARALGRCGEEAPKEARPALRKVLTDDASARARLAAAISLGLLKDRPALQDLKGRAEGDPDAAVRFAAAEAIAGMGDATLLIDALQSPDGDARREAAEVLGDLGQDEAIDPLIDALNDPLATVRAAAFDALAKLGWTPVGVKRAPDDPRYTRWMTRAEQMERAGATTTDQRELLAADLKADDPLVRQAALEALSMRHDERLATLALPLLGDPVRQVRRAAADTLELLSSIPGGGPEAAAWRVAKGRIMEAAALGDDAREVLLRTLRGDAANERADAAHALAAVGGEGVAEALAEALGDEEPYVRVNATLGLSMVAPEAVVDQVPALLADPHSAVRTAAGRTLAALPAVGPLGEALGHDLAHARHAAASALALIGPAAAEHAEALSVLATRDPDVAVRVAATDALGRIGGEHPALLRALRRDDSFRVRKAAAEALGRSGWSEAIGDLISALGDSYDAVRRAAVAALEQVGWKPTSGVGEAMIHLAEQDWKGLARVGEPAVPLLSQVVVERGGDPISVERRVRALEALLAIAERTGSREAAEAIAPGLEDEGGAARAIAAQAAGRLELKQHARRLLAMAQRDPHERARVSAAAALGRCGDTSLSEPLQELAESADLAGVRLAARQALAGPAIGDVAPLIRALQSPEAEIRRQAAVELGEVGNPDAIDPLIERLGDAVPAVRAACRAALEQLGWVPVGVKGDAGEGGFRRWLTLAEVNALAGQKGSIDQAKLLEAALGAGDPEVRRAAIETLAMRKEPSAAKAILPLLDDPDLHVRREAAEALRDLREVPDEGPAAAAWHVAMGDMAAAARLGEAVALLRALAEHGPEDREAAATALAAIESEEVVSAISAALADEAPAVRAAAARSLAALRGDEACASLEPLLSDPDGAVRRTIVEVLAGLGEAGARSLTAALDADAPAARVAALTGLARVEVDEGGAPEEVRDAVVERASGDPDPDVRVAALKTLATFGGPNLAPPVLDRLRGDTSFRVRASAAGALGRLAPEGAVEALIAALGDPYGEVRDAALAALEAVGFDAGDGPTRAAVALPAGDFATVVEVGPAALPLLGQALEDRALDPESQRKRAQAVVAISEIGGAGAPALVDRAFGDPSGRVRAAAADASGRLELRHEAPRLAALLAGDPDAFVRARCAFALGTLGATDQAPDLAEAAGRDDDPAVRSAAALALAGPGIGDVERLITQLGDGDAEVRRVAAEALGPVGNPKAIDPLIATLADAFASVREAAKSSLHSLGWVPVGVRRTPSSKGYDRWVLRQELSPRSLDAPQLEVLTGALAHPDPMLRLALAETLSTFDDPDARAALKTLSKDPDEAVATTAARAL